jgi:dolichol-phosphate mannosyltransferase
MLDVSAAYLGAAIATRPVELSIIVPTFNEAANAPRLVQLLAAALPDVGWEVIFVDDDSPDGTAEIVRQLAMIDPRVRCLHRIGRRGLASACIEGMLSAAAPYVAVMDGDLQHDETLLATMLEHLRRDRADVVVASRYIEGGGTVGWQEDRQFASRFATKLCHLLVKVEVSDPMSGFFMVRREAFMGRVRHLSAIGFKILLDLLATAPRGLRVVEVPLQFRTRQHGESKFDPAAIWEYGLLLLDKSIGQYIPLRFLSFSIIGGLGVLVHMAALAAALKGLHLPFDHAQILAACIAMTTNFFLNNTLTYRDRKLKGRQMWFGLATFYAACSIGVAANVGAASFVFEQNYRWWLAGLAGILISAVWNYAATSLVTWRK